MIYQRHEKKNNFHCKFQISFLVLGLITANSFLYSTPRSFRNIHMEYSYFNNSGDFRNRTDSTVLLLTAISRGALDS